MSAEDAYAVLEAMAEIHGYTDRLELVAPDAKEVEAEETAEDIKEARKERLTMFTFALCGIVCTDNGSYKWYKHDWQYEAEYYRKHDVPIRVLF